MIQSYKKNKNVSIMIWICFWSLKRSDFYVLTRNFNNKREEYSVKSYLRLLKNNLLEVYESDFIFMQNNASIHIVKKIKQWFDDNDIIVMNWSLYSFDLNLIEHLWFHFKELVYEHCFDIELVSGDDDKIRKTLFDALFKAWESINTYYLHDLIWSMKRRVKAIIASESWYIRF